MWRRRPARTFATHFQNHDVLTVLKSQQQRCTWHLTQMCIDGHGCHWAQKDMLVKRHRLDKATPRTDSSSAMEASPRCTAIFREQQTTSPLKDIEIASTAIMAKHLFSIAFPNALCLSMTGEAACSVLPFPTGQMNWKRYPGTPSCRQGHA